KYNFKELNEDLGLNLSEYGARWYDASLGRWWSVDLLTEQSVFFSPYCYVMNNPIIMTDPTGMYAWSVGMEGSGASDGWQQYQQEKLTEMIRQQESKKNFYVLVRSKEEIGEFYKNSALNLGTFHIVISSTLSDAQSKVSKKIGKGKISTLIIDSHGAERGGIITTNANKNTGVSGDNLEAYNRDGQYYMNNAPESYKEIKALENLINYLDDDGSICVFMTCALGKGSGGVKFMEEIGKMALPKSATFYFNQDWSNPLNANNSSKSLEIWQGPYGLSKQFLKLGWIKMTVSYQGYQLVNLKSSAKTGDIYLDSRPGRTTVTEIPR
ncbi:MAG TPA: hypothetical protein DCF33_15720, partial [Saprospirales bacterium]|nr:hypothetical protein [Saprospirales bacterium]